VELARGTCFDRCNQYRFGFKAKSESVSESVSNSALELTGGPWPVQQAMLHIFGCFKCQSVASWHALATTSMSASPKTRPTKVGLPFH